MTTNKRRLLTAGVLALIVALFLLAIPAQAEETNVFMWEVCSENGTAFLLGSMHLAPKSLYPLDERIEDSFKSSSNLVVEIDPTKNQLMVQAMFLARACITNGLMLEDLVSVTTMEKLDTACSRYGISPLFFNAFKPWFVAMSVETLELMSMGFSPMNGIDMHFLTAARGSKTVLELESAAMQLDLVDNVLGPHGDKLLLLTLSELENSARDVGSILTCWKTGDAEALEKVLMKSLADDPELAPVYEELYFKRNVQMAEKVQGFLKKGGTYFVVVGAGHMVGKKGIVQLLKDTGKYSVRQF
jgi:uncharacterized protein YbaP (TraB family)